MVGVDVVWLHLRQIELLWAENRSRSCDPDPSDERFSWDLVVLHSPETNQGSSSSQASFAMNCYSSLLMSLEVVVDNSEEVTYNVFRWCRAIYKEQVVVGNTPILEMLLVVLFLVQSDDFVHAYVLENFNILIWVMTISMVAVSVLNWTHEGSKLAWDDPVEVSVFNSLIVFVFLDVEGSEVVPAEPDSVFEALQDVEQSAIVEAAAPRCISVWLEDRVVRSEAIVCLFCCHLQNYDHECTHQEGTIHHLVTWLGR